MYSCLLLICISALCFSSNAMYPPMKECNKGVLNGNRCVCSEGYTGEVCDILLFIDPESIALTLKKEEKETKFPNFLNQIETIRIKRETEEDSEVSGSGEMPGCGPGQARSSSNDSMCVDVVSFLVEIFFTSNDAAAAFKNEIEEIDGALSKVRPFYVSFEMYQPAENGSSLFLIVYFESQSNFTSLDVNANLFNGIITELKKDYPVISTMAARDLNECTELTQAVCGSNNTCINTQGSFECRCDDGFKDETPPDTRATQSRTCAAPVCSEVDCLNSGVCFVDEENEARCSCADGYGGDRCADWVIFPWYQATVALGVICGFLLLVFVILIIVYMIKKQKKDKAKSVPMVTGYKNPAHEEETTRFDGKDDTNGEQTSKPVT